LNGFVRPKHNVNVIDLSVFAMAFKTVFVLATIAAAASAQTLWACGG
jgi:hypothetical protein